MRTRPPFDTYPQLSNSAIVLREPVPEDLERLVPISFYDGIKAAGTAEARAMLQRLRFEEKEKRDDGMLLFGHKPAENRGR